MSEDSAETREKITGGGVPIGRYERNPNGRGGKLILNDIVIDPNGIVCSLPTGQESQAAFSDNITR